MGCSVCHEDERDDDAMDCYACHEDDDGDDAKAQQYVCHEDEKDDDDDATLSWTAMYVMKMREMMMMMPRHSTMYVMKMRRMTMPHCHGLLCMS